MTIGVVGRLGAGGWVVEYLSVFRRGVGEGGGRIWPTGDLSTRPASTMDTSSEDEENSEGKAATSTRCFLRPSEETLRRSCTWVIVQTRTFLRWCNSHLAERGLQAASLCCLADGALLCALTEVLTGKQLTFNSLEGEAVRNMNEALRVLRAHGVTVVAISALDVAVDWRPSLVLGLLWAIILRFHVTLQDGR